MLIQDLNHVQIISEETHLEGGAAFASLGGFGEANGGYFAESLTGGDLYTSSYGQSGRRGGYRQDHASVHGYSRASAIGQNSAAKSGIELVAMTF